MFAIIIFDFGKHVHKGLIKIFPVNTKDQIADALTKALAQNASNIIAAISVVRNLSKPPK
jgi:hypothetical protein